MHITFNPLVFYIQQLKRVNKMLKDETEKGIVNRLAIVGKILKMVLFGSYAYGNLGKDK